MEADDILRWLGAKTPLGLLVIALAVDCIAVAAWILSYALTNLGWSLVQ